MTDVGRHDPCPCGSGRRYERCCFERERDAPSPIFLPREAREAATGAPVWQADLMPLAVTMDDDPTTRPAAVLVTAGGFVVCNDVVSRPSAEWDDVARLLDLAVGVVETSLGASPRTVEVRHPELVDALEPRLRSRGVAVSHSLLNDLDLLWLSMMIERTDEPPTAETRRARTWAAWGLPRDHVERVFRAMAALWHAAPWGRIGCHQPLDVALSDERAWTVALFGRADQDPGLVLFSELDEYYAVMNGPVSEYDDALGAGRMLSMSYVTRDRLPRPMQREVASAGWEVAAPEAYPRLSAVNTPGGGITRRDAADLARVARVLASLPEAELDRIARSERVEWRDPDTNTIVWCDGVGPSSGAFGRDEEVDAEVGAWSAPWKPPATLRLGGPDGRHARPLQGLVADLGEPVPDVDELADLESPWPEVDERARLGDLDAFDPDGESVPRRFQAALREEGLSEATVDRHVVSAVAFLKYLRNWARVPLAAVHEFDLRLFLFDEYPRRFSHEWYVQEAIPVSLRRFFGWLAEEEGIECPWATHLLGQREIYRARLLDLPRGHRRTASSIAMWRAPFFVDLHNRVLLHDFSLGDALVWCVDDPFDASAGVVETTLRRALRRLWLLWRDDAILSGDVVPARLRPLLVDRQRDWERTPHRDLDGASPLEAVQAERARRTDGG